MVTWRCCPSHHERGQQGEGLWCCSVLQRSFTTEEGDNGGERAILSSCFVCFQNLMRRYRNIYVLVRCETGSIYLHFQVEVHGGAAPCLVPRWYPAGGYSTEILTQSVISWGHFIQRWKQQLHTCQLETKGDYHFCTLICCRYRSPDPSHVERHRVLQEQRRWGATSVCMWRSSLMGY